MPPVLIIVLVVGAVYLLTRSGGSLFGGGPGAAMVASDLNANTRYANLVLPGMIQSGQATSGQVQVAGLEASGAQMLAQATAGIPIVGQITALGAALLGQHSARVKGATAENTGIDAIVPAIDADVREINAAWNQGQLSATMAVTYLSQVRDQYWQYMSQFQSQPGVAARPCPSGQVGGPLTILAGYTSGTSGCVTGQPACDKTCTAGCCVGCSAINGGIANQIWAIQTGYRGPVGMCKVFGSKFGAHDRAAYQLSW